MTHHSQIPMDASPDFPLASITCPAAFSPVRRRATLRIQGVQSRDCSPWVRRNVIAVSHGAAKACGKGAFAVNASPPHPGAFQRIPRAEESVSQPLPPVRGNVLTSPGGLLTRAAGGFVCASHEGGDAKHLSFGHVWQRVEVAPA